MFTIGDTSASQYQILALTYGDDHRAKRQVDFIIVGQGLAGTLLAHDLLEKGHSVYIIDKPLIASASKVAAGLINPVGMKRCIPSWQADVFLPFAFKRYQSLEKNFRPLFLLKSLFIAYLLIQLTARNGKSSIATKEWINTSLTLSMLLASHF